MHLVPKIIDFQWKSQTEALSGASSLPHKTPENSKYCTFPTLVILLHRNTKYGSIMTIFKVHVRDRFNKAIFKSPVHAKRGNRF